jgi:hypothetical protein
VVGFEVGGIGVVSGSDDLVLLEEECEEEDEGIDEKETDGDKEIDDDRDEKEIDGDTDEEELLCRRDKPEKNDMR